MAWQFYVQPAVTIFALGDSLWRVASGFSGMWLFPLPPPCIQLAWSGDRCAALFVKVTPCTATFLHSLSHPAFSAIVSREPLRSFLYLFVSLPCKRNDGRPSFNRCRYTSLLYYSFKRLSKRKCSTHTLPPASFWQNTPGSAFPFTIPTIPRLRVRSDESAPTTNY